MTSALARSRATTTDRSVSITRSLDSIQGVHPQEGEAFSHGNTRCLAEQEPATLFLRAKHPAVGYEVGELGGQGIKVVAEAVGAEVREACLDEEKVNRWGQTEVSFLDHKGVTFVLLDAPQFADTADSVPMARRSHFTHAMSNAMAGSNQGQLRVYTSCKDMGRIGKLRLHSEAHLNNVAEHQQLERQRSLSVVLHRHLLWRGLQSSQVYLQLVLCFAQDGREPRVRKLQIDCSVAPRVQHTVVAVR